MKNDSSECLCHNATKSFTLNAKIKISEIILIWFGHLGFSPQLSMFTFLDNKIQANYKY